MRAATTLVLLLAGCLGPAAAPDPMALEARAFDHPGGALLLVLGGGCGMCPGATGFDAPAESFALAVYADGGVARVDLNGGWGREGALHVAPGVAFDREALATLLAPTDRARGETWALSARTAKLADASAPARLAALWRADAVDDPCTDSGYDLSLLRDGAVVDHASFRCGPASGPMRELTTDLFQLASRTAPP